MQPPVVVDEHIDALGDDIAYLRPQKRIGAVFRLRSGYDAWYGETKRQDVKYDHIVVQVSCAE